MGSQRVGHNWALFNLTITKGSKLTFWKHIDIICLQIQLTEKDIILIFISLWTITSYMELHTMDYNPFHQCVYDPQIVPDLAISSPVNLTSVTFLIVPVNFWALSYFSTWQESFILLYSIWELYSIETLQTSPWSSDQSEHHQYWEKLIPYGSW